MEQVSIVRGNALREAHADYQGNPSARDVIEYFDIDQLNGEIIKFNQHAYPTSEELLDQHLFFDKAVDVYCGECGSHTLEAEEHYLCEACRKLP
jgi:predicted HicB family RNase H-like nuclease